MADALNRLADKENVVDLAKNLKVRSAKSYGPVPVMRRLWKNLGIPAAIAEAVKKETFFAYDVEAAIFRMVVGRLLDPKSKRGNHQWRTTNRQLIDRFCFDVDMLYIGTKIGYKISKVPVRWLNEPNSKVSVVKDSMGMFLDLLRIRL